MKSFLAFLLAMGSTVTLGAAACIGAFRTPEWPSRGCMINGKLYPLGEIERTEFCHRCHCNRSWIRCCSIFHTPVAYDEKECKVIFNKERCDYDVVQKDDPSKNCFVYLSVG